MKYLLPAYALAEERGYFRYPEVAALQERVPDWFRRLGTLEGATDFEVRHGSALPIALREFYHCVPLACFLQATIDGDVFLQGLTECLDSPDLPPLIEWSSERYVVVGFHVHSGLACAVRLNEDDPPAVWGFMDEAGPYDRAASTLSDWIFSAVEGYERLLDDWQNLCEKCEADPAEARRLGNAEWARRQPGMAKRLARRTEREN